MEEVIKQDKSKSQKEFEKLLSEDLGKINHNVLKEKYVLKAIFSLRNGFP